MSARDTLLAAMATALGSVAAGRVYRSRREQLPTLSAVILTPQAEEASEAVLGQLDRRLTVAVDIYAKGDTPDNAADTDLAAAWAALSGAAALNTAGVQIEQAHDIAWDYDDYDYVRATLRVTITYRTAVGAM